MTFTKQLLFGLADQKPSPDYPPVDAVAHTQSKAEKEAKDYWRLHRIGAQSGQPVATSVRVIGDDGVEVSRHPFPSIVEARAKATFEAEGREDMVWEGGRKVEFGSSTPLQIDDTDRSRRLAEARSAEEQDRS